MHLRAWIMLCLNNNLHVLRCHVRLCHICIIYLRLLWRSCGVENVLYGWSYILYGNQYPGPVLWLESMRILFLLIFFYFLFFWWMNRWEFDSTKNWTESHRPISCVYRLKYFEIFLSIRQKKNYNSRILLGL